MDWLAAVDDVPGHGARRRTRPAERSRRWNRQSRLLAARGVETLFLIGGNGTMAAGRGLAACAARAGVPLRIIGVPKTIDNDIPHTDVCPGFPSAARFLVDAVRDIGADVASMRGYEDVVLIETMGRHAGWLAAATTLARSGPDDAPHLVLVPEEPFDDGPFLSAVRHQHARTGQLRRHRGRRRTRLLGGLLRRTRCGPGHRAGCVRPGRLRPQQWAVAAPVGTDTGAARPAVPHGAAGRAPALLPRRMCPGSIGSLPQWRERQPSTPPPRGRPATR